MRVCTAAFLLCACLLPGRLRADNRAGDANNDKSVNMADAQLVQGRMYGSVPASMVSPLAFVGGDASLLEIKDLLLIAQAASGARIDVPPDLFVIQFSPPSAQSYATGSAPQLQIFGVSSLYPDGTMVDGLDVYSFSISEGIGVESTLSAPSATVSGGQATVMLTPYNPGPANDTVTVVMQLQIADSDGSGFAGYGPFVAHTVNAPLCGNGTLNGGEACDDGNIINGDGCSSTCTIECLDGYGFEPDVQGWTSSGGGATAWHRTGFGPPHTGSFGFYMGQDGTGNYSTGGTVQASLLSPVFTPQAGYNLNFWERWGVEGSFSSYDRGYVQITNSGGGVIADLRTAFPAQSGGWVLRTYSLASWVGQQIRVRFYFNSVDSAQNNYLGWLVDDVFMGITSCQCGNALLDTGEVCDDGNQADCDGCAANCLSTTGCGDGVVNCGEACDTAGPSAGCDGDCTLPVCGDGTFNPAAGEACDDGNTLNCVGTCSANCLQVEGCGNGAVDCSEACDDGNTTDCGLCNATCTGASPADFCGDGLICPGETCDDGNATDCGLCNATCTGASPADFCGDGAVCGAEVCDAAQPGIGQAGQWTGSTLVSQVDLKGNRAYLDTYSTTHILDMTNPVAPVALNNVFFSSTSFDLQAVGSRVYKAETSANNLRVFNTAGDVLTTIGNLGLPCGPYFVKVIGTRAYMGCNDRLVAVDVSVNPPVATGTYFPSNAGSIRGMDGRIGRLYIGNSTGTGSRFEVVDITGGTPAYVTHITHPSIASVGDVAVRSNRAYVESYDEFLIINITTDSPAVLSVIGGLGFPGQNVQVLGNRVYYTRSYQTLNQGTLFVIDISNELAPQILRSSGNLNENYALEIGPRHAFVGTASNGMRVMDVNEEGMCATNCMSFVTCGNGTVDGWEVCDDGPLNGMSGQCSTTCRSTGLCGNGIVDLHSNEKCDDGINNGLLPYFCTANCQSLCGNGVVEAPEACDQGASNGGGSGICLLNCSGIQP